MGNICVTGDDESWEEQDLDALPHLTTPDLVLKYLKDIFEMSKQFDYNPSKDTKSVGNALKSVIRMLCEDSSTQSNFDGCSQIISILKRHEHSEKVSMLGIKTISKLARIDDCDNMTSNELNISRLGEAGAAEEFVKLLKKYEGRELVVQEICRGIRNLVYKNEANQAKFRVAGACEAVVKIFNTYNENPNVIKQACIAIRSLAYDDFNQLALISIGAGDAVLR